MFCSRDREGGSWGETTLLRPCECACVIAVWFQLFWPNESYCISHQPWYEQMGLQEFKTEGEGKKRDEKCHRPQGKRASRPWEAGRSHTVPLRCKQQTHSTLSSHCVFPPLCTKMPGDPVLLPNHRTQLVHLCWKSFSCKWKSTADVQRVLLKPQYFCHIIGSQLSTLQQSYSTGP